MFVIGMHRSGTSAVVRVLESFGLWAGEEADFHPPTSHDPLGHREHIMVWRANETALAAAGGAWDDPAGADITSVATAGDVEVSSAIDAALARLDEHRPWVTKDPRLCITLPLWRRVATPLCVMTHRNPLEVARSLAARDGMPIFHGLALWEWYQRRALRDSVGLGRVFVSFAELSADPEGFGARLRDQLRRTAPGLSLSEAPGPAEFDTALIRQTSGVDEAESWLNPSQLQLLSALEQAVTGASDAADALAVAAAAPISAHAAEILRALVRHRQAVEALQRRDHEISQWNEHLQAQLDSPAASA